MTLYGEIGVLRHQKVFGSRKQAKVGILQSFSGCIAVSVFIVSFISMSFKNSRLRNRLISGFAMAMQQNLKARKRTIPKLLVQENIRRA